MIPAEDLFNELVEQHGGAENLSRLQLETITAIVKATEALRQATGADVPRLAGTLIKLTAQLPGGGTAGRADIARLSTDQYECIKRADKIHSGEEPPGPQKPFDPNDMSDPRARIMKKLEDIASRRDELAELRGEPGDPVAAAEARAHAAEAKAEKLRAQLEATDKVVETQRELIAALQEEQAA